MQGGLKKKKNILSEKKIPKIQEINLLVFRR